MKCHYCNKEFNSKAYTSKDNLYFCSRSCLTSHTNKNRKLSTATKLKISKSLKIRHKTTSRKTAKSKSCSSCGKQICSTQHICKSEFIRRKSKNLEKLGFDLSKIGTIELIDEYYKIKVMLENLYIHQLYSMPMILKVFKIKDYRTLYAIFNFFEIKRRTKSEARKISILCNRSKLPSGTNYKRGLHTAWNGETYPFRSSYEEDYMKTLDKNKISYLYEPFRIVYFDTKQSTNRIAIPDFYLPHSNTIVEVKSNYTYDKRNMEDKVKEYRKLGYNFKLVLEHTEYFDCI